MLWLKSNLKKGEIMATKQKINWLLILQGWAMLWVVIGHAGPTSDLSEYPQYALFLWQFAYSFHMRLFITISGFLFFLTRLDSDKWPYFKTLREKLERFGIPFLFFTLIALALKSFFTGEVDRATTFTIGEFLNAIIYPYNGPMREFWFLATIMWFFILYPVWKYALKSKWLSIILLVGLAVLVIKHPQTEFLAIKHVCSYAFYFFGGILCAVSYKANPDFINHRLFAPLTFFVGVCIYIVGRIYHIPLMSPCGGILFSLSIALCLDKYLPRTFFSFRNYTYQIYLIGIFVQVLISIIRQKLNLPFTPVYFLSMAVGLYVPVLVSKLLEWINWKPLLLCVGLKPKKK